MNPKIDSKQQRVQCSINLNKINITKIDYLEIRTEKDLEITNNYKGARLFIALYIDQIRIIDNFKLYQGISH